MDNDIKLMLKGLDGMLSSLEKTMSDSLSKMTPEEAVKFAQSMSENKVQERYKEAEEQIMNIKKSFDI